MDMVQTGDSASLYNNTLSPGWLPQEVEILRLALMKYGIGRWNEIMMSGALSGKTPAQMCLQTQRLLGQQSTSEFMNLHIDPDKVRLVNSKKQGLQYKRKNNSLVNSGNKMKKEEKIKLREMNMKQYGVAQEVYSNIVLPKTCDILGEIDLRDISSTEPESSDDDEDYIEATTEGQKPPSNIDTGNNSKQDKLCTRINEDIMLEFGGLSSKALDSEIQANLDILMELKAKRTEIRKGIITQLTVNPKTNTKRYVLDANGSSNSCKNDLNSTKKRTTIKEKGSSLALNNVKTTSTSNKAGAQKKNIESSSSKDVCNICNDNDNDFQTDFMLACDKCDNWYHGPCVEMTENTANLLDTWNCPLCL